MVLNLGRSILLTFIGGNGENVCSLSVVLELQVKGTGT